MANQVSLVRVACIQADCELGNTEANLASLLHLIEEAAGMGVDLAVFPECFLTGYCADSFEEAERISIESDTLKRVQEAVDGKNILVVVGFAEKSGGHIHNTAALLEPGVQPRFYRKTHLPELGLDRFVTPGDQLPVFDTRVGRIGLAICFDLRHPEPVRCMTLEGADIICLPTNWPKGAEASARYIAPARAAENRIFLAACNRCGTEKGSVFIGESGIYDVSGNAVARAGGESQVIVADLDLSLAREKRIRVVPNVYEWTVKDSRRPELYGRLTAGKECDGKA